METVILGDGKNAAQVEVNGVARYVRVRRVSVDLLTRRTAGVDVTDATVKVQPYEVDQNGSELAAGPVVGSTFQGVSIVDGQPMIGEDDLAGLTMRAVEVMVGRLGEPPQAAQAVPEELI
ncbi:MAG TPA: hypothetical protein VN577_19945 [Terriglobales bacterium]|nr:hypothetical protein [Terriglobales bacterium]